MSMKNKMFSVDTETLAVGDDATIVQIGAAFFDLEDEPGEMIHSFEFLVDHGPRLHNVEPYAAAMNHRILAALGGYKIDNPITCGVMKAENAAEVLGTWMKEMTWAANGSAYLDKVTFCGKNFTGFDLPTLKRLYGWDAYIPPYHHRSPDPGSMWWRKEDGSGLPDTQTCMERAGLDGSVAHTAEQDSIAAATLVQLHFQSLS